MHTKDLLGHNRRDRQRVKRINENLPSFNVAASLAFVVEPIHSGDVSTLVVATQKEKVFRIFNLVAQQQKNCLKALLTTIYVVAKK